MRAYIDSDVLIWHLRGEKKALKFFHALAAHKDVIPCIGAMQRAEVVFFMRPPEEEATMRFLAHFVTVPVDQAIIDAAAALYRTWNPSHGIDINDAILAATARQTGGKIYCLNLKHYPMPDVIVEKAWQALPQ